MCTDVHAWNGVVSAPATSAPVATDSETLRLDVAAAAAVGVQTATDQAAPWGSGLGSVRSARPNPVEPRDGHPKVTEPRLSHFDPHELTVLKTLGQVPVPARCSIGDPIGAKDSSMRGISPKSPADNPARAPPPRGPSPGLGPAQPARDVDEHRAAEALFAICQSRSSADQFRFVPSTA